MNPYRHFQSFPQRWVRAGGALYLAIIALGAFGELFVRDSLIVPGNAAASAQAIAAAPGLWRAAIAGDLLMQALDLPLILILYLLLRPVSAEWSLLAAWLNLIQTAVLVANKLCLVAALWLLQSPSVRQAFGPAQRDALAALAVGLHGYGFAIGLVFFALTCLVQGVLLWRSALVPRAVGVALGLAGLAYLLNSAMLLLAPAAAAAAFAVLMPVAFVGEMSVCLWLLVKGIDSAAWQALAARADRTRPDLPRSSAST